jgi:hypothetical protein
MSTLPADECNHRSCEAVTARMQKEAAGTSEPCPWCEVERLRKELKYAKERSFVSARISYRGFSYGTSSQWGIDSLRRAIEKDGRG